jgi:hypothetical protein
MEVVAHLDIEGRGAGGRSRQMSMPADQSDDDLAGLLRAFGIGADDVEANRAGRLGPRQLSALSRAASWRLLGAAVMVVAPAAVMLAAPAVVVLDRLPPGLDVLLHAVLDVLLGGLVLAGLGWAVLIVVGLRQARRDGVVGCLAGPVRIMLLFRQHRGWWLTVGGRSFRLPVPPDELDNGAPYRVYYLRTAHRIVAIEPTPEPTPRLRAVLPEAG